MIGLIDEFYNKIKNCRNDRGFVLYSVNGNCYAAKVLLQFASGSKVSRMGPWDSFYLILRNDFYIIV